MIGRIPQFVLLGTAAAALLSPGASSTHRQESVGQTVEAPGAPIGARIIPFVPPGLRFDLACQAQRRFDLEDGKPGARAYHPMFPYHEVTRHIVDLEALRECDPLTCELQGPQKITVTPDALILAQARNLLHFYHWRSGIYELRSTHYGRTNISQGTCRIEPFSGFPPRRARMIMVREREGTGPHPFVHEGPHPDDEEVGAGTEGAAR